MTVSATLIYVGNTNIIEIKGLKSVIEDSFINDADVEVTIKTSAGVSLVGQSWPLAMEYVDASDGIYRGVVLETVEFVADQLCTAFIDADAGDGRVGHWEVVLRPKIRRR